MDDIPEVVLVPSKKRHRVNSSSGSDGLLPSGFIAGRPVSWYGQAACSSSRVGSLDQYGMDLPGLRPDAPSRRNPPSRGRIPESLSLEERQQAEADLFRDITAASTKVSDASRLKTIVKAIGLWGLRAFPPSQATWKAGNVEVEGLSQCASLF